MYTMEYHSALKRNELQIHTIRNLKIIMQNIRSQIKEYRLHNPIYLTLQKKWTNIVYIENRPVVACGRWWGGREWEITKRYEKSFEGYRCTGSLFCLKLFHGYLHISKLVILNTFEMFSYCMSICFNVKI